MRPAQSKHAVTQRHAAFADAGSKEARKPSCSCATQLETSEPRYVLAALSVAT